MLKYDGGLKRFMVGILWDFGDMTPLRLMAEVWIQDREEGQDQGQSVKQAPEKDD